jgi:hypothetical protein
MLRPTPRTEVGPTRLLHVLQLHGGWLGMRTLQRVLGLLPDVAATLFDELGRLEAGSKVSIRHRFGMTQWRIAPPSLKLRALRSALRDLSERHADALAFSPNLIEWRTRRSSADAAQTLFELCRNAPMQPSELSTLFTFGFPVIVIRRDLVEGYFVFRSSLVPMSRRLTEAALGTHWFGLQAKSLLKVALVSAAVAILCSWLAANGTTPAFIGIILATVLMMVTLWRWHESKTRLLICRNLYAQFAFVERARQQQPAHGWWKHIGFVGNYDVWLDRNAVISVGKSRMAPRDVAISPRLFEPTTAISGLKQRTSVFLGDVHTDL